MSGQVIVSVRNKACQSPSHNNTTKSRAFCYLIPTELGADVIWK
jgi:hypothetical protein